MSMYRIEVESLFDSSELHLLTEACRQAKISPDCIGAIRKTYLVECPKESSLSKEEIGSVLGDSVLHKVIHSDNNEYAEVIDLFFRPGVTDNAGKAAYEALSLLGKVKFVSAGKTFLLVKKSPAILDIIARLFSNSLIHELSVLKNASERFLRPTLKAVEIHHTQSAQEVSLELSDSQLLELSNQRCLALTLEELVAIKSHLDKSTELRKSSGLPNGPTDVELEVIAQTWSEHCKHKIFSSPIRLNYEGQLIEVGSVFKDYIKKATFDVISQRKIDWAISVFSDNAGIVRFDKNVDLCIKVETHNSPSALDPYGGAITGILGVNRDILGCGLGAKPIANLDVLCFGPYTWPTENEKEDFPVGHLTPKQLLKGVHKGIEDGGNKSGVPNITGAFFFDSSYSGKPLVYCGTVGVMPQVTPQGRKTCEKSILNGDLAVVVGGRVGADGIHGATFSSLGLDETAPATAVQIGDPLTQKRVIDFVLEAQKRDLFRAITDNGAGGISSSLGEMAEMAGGVLIELDRCPLKYPGLAPYEIMISESQERMSLAVDPSDFDQIKQLAQDFGVELTAVGRFERSGFLRASFKGELVAQIDLDFLHNGWPRPQLDARWDQKFTAHNWTSTPSKPSVENWLDVLPTLLKSENVCSKEELVRCYDHEVLAASVTRPFEGRDGHGPNDGGVLRLDRFGGEANNGVSVGVGLAPRLSDFNPYVMAVCSVDEAVRNVISSGGDPNKCCLLDNFCWPDPIVSPKNPQGDYRLGQLVLASQGLYDTCLSYGMPLVSGKDSMKNDFKGKSIQGKEIKISVKPTLLVTAMAQTPLNKRPKARIQQNGELVFLIGGNYRWVTGSELAEHYNVSLEKISLDKIDLSKLQDIHQKTFQAVSASLLNSLHDVSEGGILVALSELSFGTNLGLTLEHEEFQAVDWFKEGPGMYVGSCSEKSLNQIQKIFGSDFTVIGRVNESPFIKANEFKWEKTTLFDHYFQQGRWQS